MLHACHKKRVFEWVSYLSYTKHLSFTVKGISNGENISYEVPYLHRWHPSYKNRMLAKFYQLDDYLNNKFGSSGRVPCTMITFTLQQRLDYSDYDDSFKKLINSLAKFRKVLNYYYGQQSWFRVMEPHKSGYPHIHMAYFYNIPKEDYKGLKDLWALKYGTSDFPDIALDFKQSSEYENSTDLKSVKNYLIKYLTKTFHSENMSATAKLFHSTMWYFGYRSWTCSRDLSIAMHRVLPDSDLTVNEITLIDKKTDERICLWNEELGKLTRCAFNERFKLVQDEVWLAEVSFSMLCVGSLLEQADRVELLDYGHYKKWSLYKLVSRYVPV